MSAPKGVSVLSSRSLAWVKDNHLPSTKPHRGSGIVLFNEIQSEIDRRLGV